jgi:hypothetical protein
LTALFHFRTVRGVIRYRELADVPEELEKRHPGSTWLLWPDGRHGPWLVRLDWTRVSGRLECCGVEVKSFRETGSDWPAALKRWDEDPEILSTTTLRRLPLGAMLHDIREEGWRVTQEFAAVLEEIAEPEATDIARSLRREGRANRSDRRRGLPPLAEVAQVYRDALARRDHPTEAVSRHWTVAHSTAAKWVMRARSDGHLPPSNRARKS